MNGCNFGFAKSSAALLLVGTPVEGKQPSIEFGKKIQVEVLIAGARIIYSTHSLTHSPSRASLRGRSCSWPPLDRPPVPSSPLLPPAAGTPDHIMKRTIRNNGSKSGKFRALSEPPTQQRATNSGNQPASRPKHTMVVARLEACKMAIESCSERTTQKIHVRPLTLGNNMCYVVAHRCEIFNVRRHHRVNAMNPSGK